MFLDRRMSALRENKCAQIDVCEDEDLIDEFHFGCTDTAVWQTRTTDSSGNNENKVGVTREMFAAPNSANSVGAVIYFLSIQDKSNG